MAVCEKCNSRSESGKNCSKCGATIRQGAQNDGPSNAKIGCIIVAVILGIALLIGIGVAISAYNSATNFTYPVRD